MLTRRFRVPLPVDLRVTLAPLSAGRGDTSIRLQADHAWRAVHTPDGPATFHLHAADGDVVVEAHGAGARWAVGQAPRMVGADDDLAGFDPPDRMVARAHHRRPGLRIGASGTVYDTLVPTILAQKVTGLEAARAWSAILRRWGGPAPGPWGLRLPPAPEVLGSQPYWAFHRLGVERKRAETVLRACRRIGRLEEALTLDGDARWRRLTALPGLGVWTAAKVLRVAAADADAVEVGDYHVPDQVAWNLAGEPRGDDARMLELLEPYRGHRGRVVRLLTSAGARPPSYGPRLAPRDLRRVT